MKRIADMESVEEIVEAYTNNIPAVYLIGNIELGFCKIGRAKNPHCRLLDIDSPRLPFDVEVLEMLRVGTAVNYVERELHKTFADRRLRGEWFRSISAKEFLRKAKALHKKYEKEHNDSTTEERSV